MFNLISNTIEGIAEIAINTVKAPIGMLVLPLDDGQTLCDSVDGIVDGLEKVGKSDDTE